MSVEALLEPLGHEVVCAGSGEQALQELLRHDFAVILLDVEMKGMDGYETAAYIKGVRRTRHVPIIFLTAHGTDPEQVYRGYEAGAVDYLPKPFSPVVLRSKVEVFVELSVKTAALERARLEHLHANQLEQLAEASVAIARSRSVAEVVRLTEGWARQIIGAERSHMILFGALEKHTSTADEAAGAELAAPLTSPDGRDTGTVQLSGKPDGFSAGDAAVLRQLAQMGAAAVDGQRRYEHERSIADTLQRSLLPKRLPEVPGVGVSARYRAGGAGVEVGGDWYDVIPLSDGRTAMVVGDVMGKGLGAAVVMGQVRTAARAYALEGHGPAGVTAHLDSLVQSLDGDHMATMVYLEIDSGSLEVRYTRAGHPPPILLGADGHAAALETGGSVPLGVMSSPAHAESALALEPGASVLLYTDGLIESRSHVLDAGLKRLCELAESGPSVPDLMCDHVLDGVPPEEKADDVALLVLRAEREAERLSLRIASDSAAVAGLRDELRGWLADHGVLEPELFEITSAFSEAAINATEHPITGASGAGVEVEAALVDGELEIAVRDHGTWRPPSGGDRGRGLPLMEALMDTVVVNPGADGTAVVLRRRLGRNGEGA